jgi:hypothetical protein
LPCASTASTFDNSFAQAVRWISRTTRAHAQTRYTVRPMRVNRQRVLARVLVLALVLWGGYVSIAWVGVPGHRAALLEGANPSPHDCADGEWSCAGMSAFVPAVTHAVGRWMTSADTTRQFSPFFWCAAITMALATAAYLGARRRSASSPSIVGSPLRAALAWLGILWLLFTAMSLGQNGAVPYRRLFEPTQQAYPAAGPEALAALFANLQELDGRGCLTRVGADARGLAAYDMRMRCIQQAFVTRVLAPLVIVIVLGWVALTLGDTLLKVAGWSPGDVAFDALVSWAVGIATLIAGLWLLALVGVFHQVSVLALLTTAIVVGGRSSAHWARRLRDHQWRWQWHWGRLIGVSVIAGFIALNLLSVVRPFPIGWDDLGLYLNKPRLLVSYGSLIPQMGTFQWEFLGAIPFAVLGYGSPLAATTALAINWSASVCAAFAVWTASRLLLPRAGVLATLIFVTLPVIAQISFADLKIDNAVFAVGTAAFLCMWQALSGSPASEEGAASSSTALRALSVSGVLSGVAFSMKATAIMLTLALGALSAGLASGVLAFVGAAAIGSAFLSSLQLNAVDVSARLGLSSGSLSTRTAGLALAVTGAVLIAITAYRRRATLTRLSTVLVVFGSGATLAVAPWLIANNLAASDGQRGILLEAPNRNAVVFDLAGTLPSAAGKDVRRLPSDLTPKIDGCRATGKSEELDRYWGTGRGLWHHVSLPWRVVMNADLEGYHVTTSALMLISPLVLLVPWFWTPAGRPLRWLAGVTAFLVLQWIVFGNGIPWYGIAIFLGLVLCVAALVTEAPTRSTRVAAAILVGVSVLFSLSLREGQYQAIRNHYEYMIGKVSPELVAERVVPHYDDIRDEVLDRAAKQPSRPFAYRIGTFIAFFVPQNLQLLPLADNQLDFFNCLNQERDPALTLRRLQALGFNSIIFDTATPTIEKDPHGSLHQKVQGFLDFVNTPNLGLQVRINDTAGGVAFLLLP